MNDRNNQYAQSMFTNMQNSEGGFFNNNPPPKLGEKSITENGTYTAKEDKLDGYSSVTADVAGGGETFEFNVTVTVEMTGEEQSPATLTSDKTYSEIVSAFNNGDKLIPTITINTIADGQTYTEILMVALCTFAEGTALWLCGYGDGTGAISITWAGNATTGLSQELPAQYISIVS